MEVDSRASFFLTVPCPCLSAEGLSRSCLRQGLPPQSVDSFMEHGMPKSDDMGFPPVT